MDNPLIQALQSLNSEYDDSQRPVKVSGDYINRIRSLEKEVAALREELNTYKIQTSLAQLQAEQITGEGMNHLTSLLQTSIQANGIVFDQLEQRVVSATEAVVDMNKKQNAIENGMQKITLFTLGKLKVSKDPSENGDDGDDSSACELSKKTI